MTLADYIVKTKELKVKKVEEHGKSSSNVGSSRKIESTKKTQSNGLLNYPYLNTNRGHYLYADIIFIIQNKKMISNYYRYHFSVFMTCISEFI